MNLIEVYHHALANEECDILIKMFEDDPNKVEGCVNFHGQPGQEVPDIKKSTDLTITKDNDGYNYIIMNSLSKYLSKYCDKFNSLNTGDVWTASDVYNIQRYNDGEGYFNLHYEHSSVRPYRILAWMYYLNDAECGTYFPTQEITLNATKGDLAIWPAFWTHSHKGVTPNIGTKYIATGWVEYVPYKVEHQDQLHQVGYYHE